MLIVHDRHRIGRGSVSCVRYRQIQLNHSARTWMVASDYALKHSGGRRDLGFLKTYSKLRVNYYTTTASGCTCVCVYARAGSNANNISIAGGIRPASLSRFGTFRSSLQLHTNLTRYLLSLPFIRVYVCVSCVNSTFLACRLLFRSVRIRSTL